jgi:hypothetical protein
MNILYLDFLNPKSHLRLDVNQISTLSKIGKVTVLSPMGRYENLPNDVNLIEKKMLSVKNGKFLNRITSLRSMIISSLISRENKHDCIIVSSFETIAFAIGRLFFKRNSRIIIMHHFNTDELSNKVKATIFRTYMNKVEHIVLEQFIKDRLISDFGIKNCKVHVLPHHMNIVNLSSQKKHKYNCVGLSNSNDESIISRIVEKEEENSILKTAGCKVVLKSKITEYDNGYLKVVKGFIENGEFEDYIESARSIYMPFPSEFKYRMSGTLVDALSNSKLVYGSDIVLMNHFASRYPAICKVINTAEDFFEYIINNRFNLNDEQLKDFNRFRHDYSTERIKEKFEKILNHNSIS